MSVGASKSTDDNAKLIGLDILKVIKDIQSRHGIREGSHLRYRQYCTKKIRSTRKILNLQQVCTRTLKMSLWNGWGQNVYHWKSDHLFI